MGNLQTALTSHSVFIDKTVPPTVPLVINVGGNPDSALLDWTSYNTASLCGFSGFRVYLETTAFSSVAGLTPIATLGPTAHSYMLSGLDRSEVYYVAVVGFNSNDEFNPAVTPKVWTDPFAGEITSNTTIGGAGDTDIDITQTIIVRNGAALTIAPGTTLRFAPAKGIIVENGKLIADGDPFSPIVMTSANDNGSGTPAAGDWLGILLTAGDTGSQLDHVELRYGDGLELNAATLPTVSNIGAFNNTTGLHLSNGAALTTTGAFLRFNMLGLQVEGASALTISQSVIKTNTSNAAADVGATANAQMNWWGALDLAAIQATVSGPVDVSNFLTGEPVLSPAVRVVDDDGIAITRNITLQFASRNAEELQASEDPGFAGLFYSDFVPTAPFLLSDVGGLKTIYARFRSVTGTESAAVSAQIQYVDQGPVVTSFSLGQGQTINRPIQVDGTVTSILGIATLELKVNGATVASTTTNALSYLWDIRTLTTAPYQVSLVAIDQGGNVETLTRTVNVSPLPPPAPALTLPIAGSLTLPTAVTVAGTAEPNAEVRIRRNALIIGTATSNGGGTFTLANVSLNEGGNTFSAVAVDLLGTSAVSNTRLVTLDTMPPNAPTLVDIGVDRGRKGFTVNWTEPTAGERPTRYEVYRSNQPFASIGAATLVVARDVKSGAARTRLRRFRPARRHLLLWCGGPRCERQSERAVQSAVGGARRNSPGLRGLLRRRFARGRRDALDRSSGERVAH